MPSLNQEFDLLTVDEAARLLHLRPSTVRDWLLRRKITYVKLGGRVFIRRTDIERLISASLVPARPDETTSVEEAGHAEI
jgi:excisionase family DNA binding protein